MRPMIGPQTDCQGEQLASPPAGGAARARLLAALLFAAGMAACGGKASTTPQPTPAATPVVSAAPPSTNLVTLTFTNPSGTPSKLSVRVEATEPDRERGLMNVSKLPDDQGDLFVFQDVAPNRDVIVPFWMKDTLIPLSIAFVSADGRVLEEQDMAAQSEALHAPHLPYRYAIEANIGWYFRHGVTPGSTVDLPAALQTPAPSR